jgi:predicted HTH transcriptional regulator
MVVARTISSFMNSNGGLLLIGVDNDKNILGLEKDLAQLDGSADKFELHITNVINNHLGKIKGTLVAVRFENIEGKQIAVLTVKKSPRPVYLKYEGKLDFFIRSGNSCQLLDVSEATEYIKDHWPDLP